MPVAEILQGIDAVIITHTHLDHIDPTALEIMDKRLPVFVQDNKDAGFMRKHASPMSAFWEKIPASVMFR